MQKHKRKVNNQIRKIILDTHFLERFSPKDRAILKKNKANDKIKVKSLFYSFKTLKAYSPSHIVYLSSKKRNSRLSLCSKDGKHIFSYTVGNLGNKKSARGNVYYAKELFRKFHYYFLKHKVRSFSILVNGLGRTRRPILWLFAKSKLRYSCGSVIDVTPVVHNGCRSRMRRRL